MTITWRWGIIRGHETRPVAPILKVGGSLLSRPAWPTELAALVRGIDRPLLVVGGGGIVDGLRAIDTASPQPRALMHELAIDAMSFTARLVADALAVPIVSSSRDTGPAVLNIADWLAKADDLPVIPAGWEVTSDSLAAVAAATSDRPFVLAKSVPPPTGAATIQSLAAAGWVDGWFPTAAAPLAGIAWAAPAE